MRGEVLVGRGEWGGRGAGMIFQLKTGKGIIKLGKKERGFCEMTTYYLLSFFFLLFGMKLLCNNDDPPSQVQ